RTLRAPPSTRPAAPWNDRTPRRPPAPRPGPDAFHSRPVGCEAQLPSIGRSCAMSPSISKQMMLRIAADYERLADRADLHTQRTSLKRANNKTPPTERSAWAGFYGSVG